MITFETRTVVQVVLDENAADRRATLDGDERAWARVYRDAFLPRLLLAVASRARLWPTGSRNVVSSLAPSLLHAVQRHCLALISFDQKT